MFEGGILGFLVSNYVFLAFLSGFILGDMLLVLAALAGAGGGNIGIVYAFGLLGEVVHDSLFFYIGKTRFVNYIKIKLKLHKRGNLLSEIIDRFTNTRFGYFTPLFFAKFFYGVRDSAVLYYAHMENNFRKYFFTCTLAAICNLAIMVSIGWLAGRGLIELRGIYHGIEMGIGLLILLLIGGYIAYNSIGRIALKIIKRKLKINLIKNKK